MAQLKKGKVSILVVPEKQGAVFSFKLPVLAFRLAVIAGALAVLFFLVMAVSWLGLMRKASIYDRLAEENKTLLQEHDRILALQNRVARLQELEDQIRRVLGIEAGSDSSRYFSLPHYNSRMSPSEEDLNLASAGRVDSRSETGLARAGFSLPTRDPEILKSANVPSLWPVQGFISRGFERNEVIPRHGHFGVDIAAQEGTAVAATAGGAVVWAGWSPLYGNMVVLAHSSGYYSVYGHNQLLLVHPRDLVQRGDPIALLGNTGQSSAPHLHFEIWHGTEPLDPLNLLMPFN